MTTQPPLLLTSRDAAALLAISKRTVSALLATGRLDAVRIGRRCTRVTRESVERLARPETVEAGDV